MGLERVPAGRNVPAYLGYLSGAALSGGNK